jgi:hypothetical protein
MQLIDTFLFVNWKNDCQFQHSMWQCRHSLSQQLSMIGPRLRMGVHFFPVETSLHRIGAQTTYSISATLNTALSSIAQVPHTKNCFSSYTRAYTQSCLKQLPSQEPLSPLVQKKAFTSEFQSPPFPVHHTPIITPNSSGNKTPPRDCFVEFSSWRPDDSLLRKAGPYLVSVNLDFGRVPTR